MASSLDQILSILNGSDGSRPLFPGATSPAQPGASPQSSTVTPPIGGIGTNLSQDPVAPAAPAPASPAMTAPSSGPDLSSMIQQLQAGDPPVDRMQDPTLNPQMGQPSPMMDTTGRILGMNDPMQNQQSSLGVGGIPSMYQALATMPPMTPPPTSPF